MSYTVANTVNPSLFLSEITCLTLNNSCWNCFKLNHQVTRKIGNRFSWQFSHKFPDVVVIFEDNCFWVLAKDEKSLPSPQQWKEALSDIQEVLREDIGDLYYSIHWLKDSQITALVTAQLAIRILKIFGKFSYPIVFPKDSQISENQVQVRREVNFWAEIINDTYPSICLTVESSIVYSGDLEQFYENHPYRQDAAKLLVGLKVKDRETNGTAKIIKIAGTIGEKREELLTKATGSISRRKLEEADLGQPVVAVKFGKNPQEYIYPLAALKPCMTDKDESLFQVNYGELLKATKIPYVERQKLLQLYKQEAQKTLNNFGVQLRETSINSKKDPQFFWTPSLSLKQTPILFGKGERGEKGDIIKGLSRGGVYKRHREYEDPARKIRLAILKPANLKVGDFREQLQNRLDRYKFNTILPPENQINFSVEGVGFEKRARLEEAVDQLIGGEIPVDIALVFLPQEDRNADNTEEGSLYSWIKRKFLDRGVITQMIYEKTLNDKSNYNNILNQVVPGILAKLGNLPYVLAEPLEIADYFIGLDVGRIPKKNLPGSLNVCASVRLYGKQGEFVRCRVEDSLTEGEEIPQRMLEKFLPQAELKNQKVLIYRDGKFQGKEVDNLLARARAINAKLILVECYKTGIPRLYNLEQKQINAPSKGLAFALSKREVILITSQVSEQIGVPRPLRLKVHELGEPVDLKQLVDTTLKLTLLHYGSLKEPRLPIPLYGADAIAYRRLQGIYPSLLEDDCQFWL
ncbi:Piwi domain-containing protein [Microcystis aeruginosa CS-563/04]|uniref:Piwi domain-containing protein n=1 Tax=Microcystis aeruginosa TaxID=1126 RepID=UPI002330D679|nr:Piwi domain-containing protein [Microcystis aeruginosa]MDB9419489.1 Piwi domain-containing protein [Microcystis aeruginosa CS-563/04]